MDILAMLLLLLSQSKASEDSGVDLSLPRGLRNNNPGNIKKSSIVYKGELIPSADTLFKQFSSMGYGYRAMLLNLAAYLKHDFSWSTGHKKWKPSAQTGKIDTIYKIINTWAPPTDNNPTDKYINYVAKATGISPDTKLATADLVGVAAAISAFENGKLPDMAALNSGYNMMYA